ncbi:hypothetical protein ACH5RR_001612 [Cinchona calisaya]|uniref:Calmodulin-binding protein n=1 Tax=Cinchona calisaya TaxID=153742 RepID=A0ABD3B471_9GENT
MMVLKRCLEGGEDEEGSQTQFPNRDLKRRNVFAREVSNISVPELVSRLEPFLRKCVSQEVERAISSYLRPSLNQIDSSGESRMWQLHFDDKLPCRLFTGCRVEAEDSGPVKVMLRDSRSRRIITSGPLSSIKVTVVVLDGDFNKDDQDDWTEQEFNYRTVREREGKRPLVTGTLAISLKNGVGHIEDISFTDNSSWIRSGKFRLGAITNERSIREGMSNAFKVKDHRGESYKKHHPPSSVDEVWRLEKIAKDGASHKRLAANGISNVKDFLRLYVTDPYLLRNILGGKISNKAWKTIIEQAAACLLDDNELYLYKAADGTVLVLNSIYEVVGASFDGESYLSLNMLDISQKLMVENMKRTVYKNVNYLVPVGDQSFLVRPLLLSSSQASSYRSPSSSLQNVNFPVEQDQMEMQVNSDPTKIAPMRTYELQEGNQFKISAGETSHHMEPFNSFLSNSFIIRDSYDELQASSFGWDTTGSFGTVGLTDHQPFLNENFQVETSAWQGNGFFVTPRNQALGVLSSDFGIRISSNGKPKASWCKIRAVVKWRMIKSSCQKNGKAFKYHF